MRKGVTHSGPFSPRSPPSPRLWLRPTPAPLVTNPSHRPQDDLDSTFSNLAIGLGSLSSASQTSLPFGQSTSSVDAARIHLDFLSL